MRAYLLGSVVLGLGAAFLVSCARRQEPETPSIAVDQSKLSQRMAMGNGAGTEAAVHPSDGRDTGRNQQSLRSPPSGLDSVRDERGALFDERERERLAQ